MQMLCNLSGDLFRGGCNDNYSDGGLFAWLKQVWMVSEYRERNNQCRGRERLDCNPNLCVFFALGNNLHVVLERENARYSGAESRLRACKDDSLVFDDPSPERHAPPQIAYGHSPPVNDPPKVVSASIYQ